MELNLTFAEYVKLNLAINVPIRSALVLETKDAIVSLVTNLNYKKMFVNSDIFYSTVYICIYKEVCF